MQRDEMEIISTELKNFKHKAQQGEDEYWFKLGCRLHEYAQQYELIQEFDKAFHYYYVSSHYWIRAVQHGIAQAKPYLYHAYLCGQGIDKKNKIAFEIIESIEPDFDNVQQQFSYACLLWQQNEREMAIDFLELIANKGYAKAHFFMYIIYNEGFYRAKNIELASNYLYKAAWRNDAQAQYTLGIQCHVKSDYQASVNWLLKAINQCDSENYHYQAQQQLIQYAEQQTQIVDILEKKASEGDTQAIKFLAQLYKQAKIHLENMMALFAHKLRAPLQHIEYNVKSSNNPKQTLRDVESMQRFLNLYGFISSHSQQLQQKLQQDKHGNGRLIHVLERSLIDAITPLLSTGNRIKIKQHYLHYAKQNQLVPQTTKLRQWDDEYLQTGYQLQTDWSESFFKLIEQPQLYEILNWFEIHFFPIKIQNFETENIQFERFSITEEVLVALLSEMLLNIIKYYHAAFHSAASLHWHCEDNMCTLTATNPTSEFEQKLDKGSKKGQDSLLSIARKVGGDFQAHYQSDCYQAVLNIPAKLLIKRN